MSTLVLGNLEDSLARKLRSRARKHGVSEESEAKKILSQALADETELEGVAARPEMSFAEFIVHGAPPWPDDFVLTRSKDTNEKRRIEF